METKLALGFSIALLLQIAVAPAVRGETTAKPPTTSPSQSAPATQPVVAAKGGEMAALERKILGTWRGPLCKGDYTFNPDGTYTLVNFTPGGNTLTGTWSIRWDALPPTLLLTCKTSDFKKKYPDRPEYEFLNKTREVKLLELNGETLIYRAPDPYGEWRGQRPEK